MAERHADLSGADSRLKALRYDDVEVFFEIVALQSAVIDQQGADRPFGNVKMLGDILSVFRRVITRQHAVRGLEWAQKLGSE
jgi:hypothetical protein